MTKEKKKHRTCFHLLLNEHVPYRFACDNIIQHNNKVVEGVYREEAE